MPGSPHCSRRLKLELRGMTPCVVGWITEIINQMMGEFQFAFFKEALPSNPLGPLTQTFIFVGAFGIGFHDFLDG